MKAQNPIDHKWYYFIDKCMPFGASISCSHFQRFSNAVAHLVKYFTGKENINYLDDFFFVALMTAICDNQVSTFLNICESIRFPVSMEKTFWSTTRITFLGDKIEKARILIKAILVKDSKKITLHQLQSVTGFLNFISKAIIPGRTFTRRLYSVMEGAQTKLMKKHHHINLTKEMKLDLETWLEFLNHPSIYARPFLDVSDKITSEEVDFYTDASANPELGCGGISDQDWFIMQWDEEFITKYQPSINYLELYAVTVAVVNWLHKYRNKRITIFCDNMSVVNMINNTTSKCKNCMVLLRIMVLQGLTMNVRISAKHVPGKFNIYADMLSRLKYKEFWKKAKQEMRHFSHKPSHIPEILEMKDIWMSN